MLTDILGRQIKDGDVVVAKGNNWSGSNKGMEVGIAVGDSIRTLTCSRRPHDLFLVENPSKVELEIKKKIIEQQRYKLTENKIKKQKEKGKNADEVGAIYIMKHHLEAFIYLGKRTISSYADNKLVETKTGNVYLSLGRWVRDKEQYKNLRLQHILDKQYMSPTSSGAIPYNFETLKGYKTYAEKIGKCNDDLSEITIVKPCGCRINNVKPYDKLKVTIK